MATQHDRPASVHWQDRAVFGDRHGVPWWAAVLIAIALTAAGLVLDLEIQRALALTFKACYFVGCVMAVLLVKRSGLFAPMVQPPLILAVAVPGLIIATAKQPVNPIDVVQPLIQGFPTMAITTGAVLLISLGRYLRERESRQQPGQSPSTEPPPRREPTPRDKKPTRPARPPRERVPERPAKRESAPPRRPKGR